MFGKGGVSRLRWGSLGHGDRDQEACVLSSFRWAERDTTPLPIYLRISPTLKSFLSPCPNQEKVERPRLHHPLFKLALLRLRWSSFPGDHGTVRNSD